MKYLPLIWAGLWRRPVRTVLTLLSVTTAFFLFGMLQGIDSGYQAVIAAQRLDRLMIDPRVPGSEPMPISALAKIEALPEVTRVCGRSLMFGQYQDRKNMIVSVATHVDDFFAVRTENQISPEHLEKLKATRDGMAMPYNMAESLGLKLGDRFPLQTRVVRKDGSTTWEADTMATHGKTLTVDPEVIEVLVREGYSPACGARYLKRVLDDRIRIPLSQVWSRGTSFTVTVVGDQIVTDVEHDAEAEVVLN